ncbi:MAG: TIR domain-containing protein [Pirellulaceae bacterium]
MDQSPRVENATQTIRDQLTALKQLVETSIEHRDHDSGFERLRRWKARTCELLTKHVHANEGRKLLAKQKYSFRMGDPLGNLHDEALMYQGFLLALLEDLEQHPSEILDAPMPMRKPPAAPTIQSPDSSTVFIIHGHDELNLLRLKEIVRERWQLDAVVLAKQASKGRTIIEKFEAEAQRACYAFALLTPDDMVTCKDQEYAQARPNVIFELGWFFGRLGRDRVAILFKQGTMIHSDLDGICRIQFDKSVDEIVPDMERELVAANVLNAQNEGK